MRLEPSAAAMNGGPLKICMLGYRSNPHCGGQGVYIKNLSRALQDLGHRVTVLSGPPYPDLDDDVTLFTLPSMDMYHPDRFLRLWNPLLLANPFNFIEWLGITSMGFSEPLAFGMRAHQFIRSRAADFDIVHDNQSLSYGLWSISQYLPTTATIHHPISIDRTIAINSARSALKKVMEWRWYSFVGMQQKIARTLSRILTVSQNSRRNTSREFKIPSSRFRVVPNGIDLHRFHRLPGVKREANRIMVTNSADEPLKGLAYLLKAVARVSRKREVRLIVIGTPKKNGHTVKLVRKLGIGHLVTFTGRVDHTEFVRQYARAGMAVVPSLYEGFGLPAGEAMACGVPVISTSAGALPEVVGNDGIIVPPADHRALAVAIETLLQNPEKAKALGSAGYQRVHSLFTWRSAAEKTVDVYKEVIRDHHELRAA